MAGHVEKSGSSWKVIIELGRDENGKRQRRTFRGFKTKKDAQKFLTEKEHEINTGTYIDKSNETFQTLMSQWLEDKKNQVRPTTFRGYEWLIRRHIIPGIGNIKIEDLKPMHLQQMYSKWQSAENPLSKRSILHAHMIIHQVFGRAVRWGLIARNIADLVDPPKPQGIKMSSWDEDATLRFLNTAKTDPYYIVFVLAIFTGMRKSEILGLRWSDIDVEHSTLAVSQTSVYTGHGTAFGNPKTDRGKRAIALPPIVIDELRLHRRRQAQQKLQAGLLWEEYNLVVTNEVGRPLPHRTLDNHWYAVLKNADVPKIRFHDLRHTHASLMLKHGVHPKIVSERLGHSNIGITLDVYSHVLPGLQEQAAQDFQDALLLSPNKSKKTDERNTLVNKGHHLGTT